MEKICYRGEDMLRDVTSEDSVPVGIEHDQLLILGTEIFIDFSTPFRVDNGVP